MLRSTLCSLLLLATLCVSAAEFQFDATGVTAHVTPNATAYWACAAYGASRYAVIVDTDGDGVVRWEQGDHRCSGVYTLIDGTSRSITTMRSDGSEAVPAAFPAKAFLRDETGAYTRFAMEEIGPFLGADWIYFFWVRPGVGAWEFTVPVGGSRDELPAAFRMMMFDVRRMFPVGNSPSAPSGIEPGDLFVLYDYHLRFWTGSLVDSRLGESVGSGVAVHAKTAGHEDDKKMTITLARVEGTDGAASVHYETADDTAKAGVHYQASSGTATFPPGHIFSSFDVPVIDDQTDANRARFKVNLSNPSGATLRTTSFDVTIPDNDDTPIVTLPSFAVPEGDGGPKEVPVKVSLNHTAPQPVTLEWATKHFFSRETITSGVLQFTAGEKEKTISASYVADDEFLGDQRIAIVITNAINANAWQDGRLTIIEDDPPPTITVTGATVSESEGTATVTVSLSKPLTMAWNLTYFTEDGSATSPADYAGTPENIAPVAAGVTTVPITVPIHNDAISEAPESFRVSVYAIGTGVVDIVSATVTILDDEQPSVAIEQITVSEGGRGPNEIPVEVTLSHPAPKPVTLEWKAYDLVTNAAVDTGVLQFGVGERVRSLNVRYVADDLWGPDRQLGVVITKATNATLTTEGRVTIIEDELPPAMTAAGVTVREGDGLSVIHVALSEPVREPVRGTYRAYGRTAVPLQDFVSTAGEFVIPAGSTIVTIDVPIVNDSVAEEPESFTVVIEAAMIATAPITATVTILDDDAQGRRRSMRR